MQIPPTIDDYQLSPYAKFQLSRLDITSDEIEHVIMKPDETEIVKPGMIKYEKRIRTQHPGRLYSLEVYVDAQSAPPRVMTVYRTWLQEKSDND